MLSEYLQIKNTENEISELVTFLKNELIKNECYGFVIGNSGGIDSAVVSYLAVKAAGTEHVISLYLPERETSKISRADAELIAAELNLHLETISIVPILKKLGIYRMENPSLFIPQSIKNNYVKKRRHGYESGSDTAFIKSLHGGINNSELQKDIAYYSAKNRVRMTVLYREAEKHNYMVLGTANRSEWETGLFIKYGDGACDAAPIINYYKTEVYQLAHALKIPEKIINKKPAGDLAPGLTDEDTLNISYSKLDQILLGFSHNMSDYEILNQAAVSIEEIAHVKKIIKASESMRKMPASKKHQI